MAESVVQLYSEERGGAQFHCELKIMSRGNKNQFSAEVRCYKAFI